MSQSRTRAFNVIRAAARLKVLGARIQAEKAALQLQNDVEEVAPVSEQEPLLPSVPSVSFQQLPPLTHKSALARDFEGIKEMLMSSYINVFLFAIPVSFVSSYQGWNPVYTFSLSFLSLIPLALILGDITEDLALRFGDVVGGLINATFGNVVEIILSIAALQKNLYTVVSMSLIGSILSNLLLVLGCSFFFGGLKNKTQTFNAVGNRACSSLLFLACIGIIIPTAAEQLIPMPDSVASDLLGLRISRGAAILLLISYGCYLLFQLRTHRDYFSPAPTPGQGEEEHEDVEIPMLSLPTASLFLGIITIIVAICSEFLTGSIEQVSSKTGLGEAFLGMIVLPIAGNACEHITAVMVAMKNKMDLAIGVAVGSSIQIALFAIPLVVVVGWATGHPFSLSFDSFSVLVVTVSVLHCNVITGDSVSHWMLGTQLIVVYGLVALAYLFR
mmetsp:Transcript_7985/g.15527  ORF Transcript_7985/g.15527 Transcript_7985/m.15527 type:complete len:444 (-) Transcript_7985:716-2047(-)